jgi:hypothetical protein
MLKIISAATKNYICIIFICFRKEEGGREGRDRSLLTTIKIKLNKPLLKIFNIADMRGCIQKFPDRPPGARTANGTALCDKVQLYRYFVSQSSEFCHRNTLCCFSTSVYFRKRMFRYRLSPKTFGYTLII